jgi:hypothetical protein
MLDQLRLSIASQLPPDWCHETRFSTVADLTTLIVETITYGREITDEQERVSVPASAWDSVKVLLNERLLGLDRWLHKKGLPLLRWRFRVQGREIVTKRVYHVCPHVGGEWKDHIRYVCIAGRSSRESRVLEHVRYLLAQPLNRFDHAETRLSQLKQMFQAVDREGP